jgi:hypothetical protein
VPEGPEREAEDFSRYKCQRASTPMTTFLKSLPLSLENKSSTYLSVLIDILL